jgi:hypothetical protein
MGASWIAFPFRAGAASRAYWAVKIARLCSVSASSLVKEARAGRNPDLVWMPQLSKCPAQATHELQEIFFAVRRSLTNV